MIFKPDPEDIKRNVRYLKSQPRRKIIMKPTHILVSIADFQQVQKIGTFDAHRKALQNLLYNSPSVDLSEEGIASEGIKSYTTYINNGVEAHAHYINGYQQCAKDLLNTKP